MPENLKEYFLALPTLETPRVILRQVGKQDLQDMWEYANDPKMSDLTIGEYHQNIGFTESYIDRVVENYAQGIVENWGVELISSHKLIGMAGFCDVSAEHKVGEIGYVLSTKYWNQGIMTETVKAIVAEGFLRLGLEKIFARFISDNLASKRILEKTGFTKEAHLRHQFVKNGVPKDIEIFGILKEEMPSRGNMLMHLLTQVETEDLEIFNHVLQNLLDNAGRVASVSSASLAESGKPGLANDHLIHKLQAQGVLQPSHGDTGIFMLTPEWEDLMNTRL